MREAGHEERDVRELQSLIEEAPIAPQPVKRRRLSRAARLHLIDVLSRWAASGLAVLAGASIYLSIAVGRQFPGRATVWIMMVIAAMWFARRLQSQYRAGAVKSSRPFRWRASYTASLSVLGVTFGSAVVLLSPDMFGNAGLLHVGAVALAAAVIAALMHSAHLPSALSILLPTSVFLTVKLLAASSAVVAFGGVCLSVLAFGAIYIFYQGQCENAASANPWTRFVRKEVEPAAPQTAAQSGPASDRLHGLR